MQNQKSHKHTLLRRLLGGVNYNRASVIYMGGAREAEDASISRGDICRIAILYPDSDEQTAIACEDQPWSLPGPVVVGNMGQVVVKQASKIVGGENEPLPTNVGGGGGLADVTRLVEVG